MKCNLISRLMFLAIPQAMYCIWGRVAAACLQDDRRGTGLSVSADQSLDPLFKALECR